MTKINPDTNPTYQELIDTLVALNCSQRGYIYRIHPVNETECQYSCHTPQGVQFFSDRLTFSNALIRVKSAHSAWIKRNG